MRKRLIRREVDETLKSQLVESGYHPLVARIVAGRSLVNNVDPFDFLKASIQLLDRPESLHDVNKAAERIVDAIERKETIGIVADYDADGNGVLSVALSAFIDYFHVKPELLRPYISDRLTEGYGLTEGLCRRILEDPNRPTLVISGDCGSSDEARIKTLGENNCAVIVSDHHEFPELGPPASAFAVVSPIHPDGEYPDRTICGGMVTWLLMAVVRTKLLERASIPADTAHLGALLDFCSVSTVADCVSMASINNRAVVKYGLDLINRQTRPAWRAFMGMKKKSAVTAGDLAFSLGPMLNANGRLADAFGSVSFLCTKTDEDAQNILSELHQQNEERKQIERALTIEAIATAETQVEQYPNSIVVYLPGGHPGVIGIVASRLKEHFGLPSIVLANSQRAEGLVTGSARGIDYANFHARDALQSSEDKYPGLFTSFGGHRGAAGMSLPKDKVVTLRESFDEACASQLSDVELGPVVVTDGDIDGYPYDMSLLESLDVLEPHGRGFEKPVFEIEGNVVDIQVIGSTKTHLRVWILPDNQSGTIKATWFNVRRDETDPLPISIGDHIRCAGSPEINEWNGSRSPQFLIKSICG